MCCIVNKPWRIPSCTQARVLCVVLGKVGRPRQLRSRRNRARIIIQHARAPPTRWMSGGPAEEAEAGPRVSPGNSCMTEMMRGDPRDFGGTMREDSGPYSQVQPVWKCRLERAKQRLDFTYAFVIEVELDDRAGRTSPTEKQTVYDEALQYAVQACNQYCHLLQIYAKLLAHGVIPDETDWRHSQRKRAAARPRPARCLARHRHG